MPRLQQQSGFLYLYNLSLALEFTFESRSGLTDSGVCLAVAASLRWVQCTPSASYGTFVSINIGYNSIQLPYEGDPMALARYHVIIDDARTTVSLPPVLAELLALKRGIEPRTPEAHAAVRLWLQQEIDRDPGAVRRRGASQRLARQAILAIAAPGLIAKHDDWLIRDG
jgi:hypothetical protein